jgi:hypothetical protein
MMIVWVTIVFDVPIALSYSGELTQNIFTLLMRKNYIISILFFYFKDHEKFKEDFNVARTNASFYKK